MDPISPPNVGNVIRFWRQERGMSQMELALEADTSSRHLSCVETGRAMPTRALLDQIASVLDIPIRIHNGLLLAAGFAPAFQDLALDGEEASEVRLVLEKILLSHQPYPAMIMDRNLNILMWNNGLNSLVRDFVTNPSVYDSKPWNMLNLLFHPEGWSNHIENLEEIYMVNMSRAHRALIQNPDDETLKAQMELVASYRPKEHQKWEEEANQQVPQFVLPVHYKKDNIECKLFTTTSSLGSVYNITLPDLQIEAGYPVNEAGESYFKSVQAMEKEALHSLT